jgi:hypothetical protein
MNLASFGACGFSAYTSVARGGHATGRIRTDVKRQGVDCVVDGAVEQRVEAVVAGRKIAGLASGVPG